MKAFYQFGLAIACLQSLVVSGQINKNNKVTICVKKKFSGRFVSRNVSERWVRIIRARGGGFVGDKVPGYKDGYIFGPDCQPMFDESLIVDPPPDEYDCDQCPCGYYDGCNSCGCVSSSGVGACTRKFCEVYEQPRCEPCTPPPPSPDDFDCTQCPCAGSYFDGCNICTCDSPAACTLKFCEVYEEPRCQPCPCEDDTFTCSDGTVLTRDGNNDCKFPKCPVPPLLCSCCDPSTKPSIRQCFEGVECCPNTGEWACSIGDGSYVCGDLTIRDNFGEPCGCPKDLKVCPDGSEVKRDPNNYCKFPPCSTSPPPEKCCDPAERPGLSGSNICKEGSACCPDGTWSCSIGDGKTFPCGGELITAGFGKPCSASGQACCNPLDEPGQFGNPLCIEGAACCPDGTWSCSIGDGVSFPCGDDTITSGLGEVCELDCELCPGGFYDGCNTCACDVDRQFPLCTLRACGPDLDPKTCNQTPSPPPQCCNPAKEPGQFGNLLCDEGHACCPDGTWSCSIGDGISFPCGGELITSGFGERCDESSTTCCNPLDEPGQFNNPLCIEGAACCPDGTWSCSIGDGVSFPCGNDTITSGFGEVCELDCELCPGGFYDGCNTCSCDVDRQFPICTLRACGPDLDPKTCNQKPPDLVVCTQELFICEDGSPVGRDPDNNCEFTPCELDCEVCPGGFYDGCNSCGCDGNQIAGCTERACEPEELEPKICSSQKPPPTEFCTADVQECPDGSFVGRDPNNGCAFYPCEVDCDTCPGGFFDGCNFCDCSEDGPICTKIACGPDLLPKTCNQIACTLDARICSDGSAVGRDPENGCAFFPCPAESTCCDPKKRPGVGGSPICTDGVTCCEACCEWSCGIGDGSFACDATCGYEEVNCDTCACGFNDGCNDCQCGLDGSVTCTERRCIWQGIPSCLDCPSPPSQVCSQKKSCEKCLESNCVWTVDMCLPTCDIQDVACYISGDDDEATCAAAAKDKDDLKICSALEDCSSCIATYLSDGVEYCQWYSSDPSVDGGASGYCGTGGCDVNGVCGKAKCPKKLF